jgi:UDP-N-acetylglucosamine 2-epimerase (non-hydrolysing)/GDP/UDP-N,N'-diacetylbacillosamine 2-epimerase (hydrolysing)
MLKVMSITGSRADYGLMRPIYSLLESSTDMTLQLIVLGMHNHSAYKETLEQIYNDGFGDILRIQNEDNKQSKNLMLDEMSDWIYHIPRLMEQNKPDILLLQGDRGEMLAGAIAAAHKNIPIVHMSGGDVTGSVDNHIRNAVSKFSHFHLATCQSSARNLELMGELQERIKVVGEPGVDAIHSTKLIEISEFKRRYFIPDEQNFALISFHPVTNDLSEGKKGIALILKEVLDSGINVLVTYPNTDTGSEEIVSTIEKYRNSNLVTILPDMGQVAYFSAMKHAKFLIGNSSSGIIESPYFGLPTINVGSRQELREKSSNVIDVRVDSFEIRQAINRALLNSDFIQQSLTCLRPYGEGDTAIKTIEVLRNLPTSEILLRKYQQGLIAG